MPPTQTYPIQPFTPEGAAHIASIVGQQPVTSTSASVVSTPTMPQLPQQQQTATPTAPPLPTFDEIFNTPKTDLQTAAETTAGQIGTIADQTAGEPAFRGTQETQQ